MISDYWKDYQNQIFMQIILQVTIKTRKKQNEEKEQKPYLEFWCFFCRESEMKLKNLETTQLSYGAQSIIKVLNLLIITWK